MGSDDGDDAHSRCDTAEGCTDPRKQGTVAEWYENDVEVRVRGESWRAHCRDGVDQGDAVVVLAVSGLTLEVRPK
jgi:membrane protein implicated in regulation of membrane protease activity